MDFFGRQEQARKNTAWLVFLFASAVVLINTAVYFAIVAGLWSAQFFGDSQSLLSIHSWWDPVLFMWVSGITALVVASGSFYRTYQLRKGGGAAVAEMLGGERVPATTDDPLLRRLLNVVEEMAIASGLPVPPVYLLQQSGINAFAAGFAPTDAVIATTRGAIELLNRNELQGVIAHEFSHILNGDTRLKMRLMGLLFGITLISDAGILMLTSRHSVHDTSSRRRERGVHPALLVMGFLLFMVGTVGAVFADMIKRAVSRQREFLADAAAVQFTRNPSGIANALKVIGGYKEGSRIRHAATEQASHFFFGNAMKSWKQKDWWATHPPLAERIRRLDPGFRGTIATIDAQQVSARVYSEAMSAFDGVVANVEHLQASVSQVMQSIGNPGSSQLMQARALLQKIPARVKDFTHDPYTARATVYALMLHRDSKQRAIQLKALQQVADPDVYREVLDIQPEIAGLDAALRIPLLEMLLPTLKILSKQQYKRFRHAINTVIKSDGKVNVFEYMLHRMLLRHLKPAFYPIQPVSVKFEHINQLVEESTHILVCLICFGAHADRHRVFTAATEQMGLAFEMPEDFVCRFSLLDAALKKFERAAPGVKKQLMGAAVFCVLADGRIAIEEQELLRAIADALDSPMPPLALNIS